MDRAVFIHNTLRDFVSHLTFRVADYNIIVRHEERIADLTLCAEGFTGTGSAQNQTVGVLQLFAVNHNQVVGQSVQAIIQAFLAVVEQLLRGKRPSLTAGSHEFALQRRYHGHDACRSQFEFLAHHARNDHHDRLRKCFFCRVFSLISSGGPFLRLRTG